MKGVKRLPVRNYHYIKQVAYKVGLRPKYFSTLFKQKVGVTPSEYRRKAKGTKV